MRDFYLGYLTTFGLGAAIAFFPILPSRAAQPETPEPESSSTPTMTMAGLPETADSASPSAAAAVSAPQPLSSPAPAPAPAGTEIQSPAMATISPPQPLFSSSHSATETAPADSSSPQLLVQAEPMVEPEASEDESAPLESPAGEASPEDSPAGMGEAVPDDEPSASPQPEMESPTPDLSPQVPEPVMESEQPEPSMESETTEPEAAGLSDDELPRPLPEYLQPSGNPLLTPTQPEEVDIIGTQPIALETAVELAYRNNEELQVALLELERSRAGLREARAALYPTVDASAGVRATNDASPTGSISPIFGNTDTTSTVANAGVELNYDLGLSGRRGAQIRAAEESVRNAELQVEQVQAQLRLETINDYYAVQDATAQIAINQAFLDEAERNLNDTVLREEVGVGTRFDVLRSQVQVANARQNVIRAQSQRRIAQRQLAARLNVPPTINVDTLPVERAGAWPLSLEESIVLAYQGRAELEQLLVQRQISEEQRQIALSAVRPEVGLFANYNVVQGFSTNASEFDDGFSLGAQLQWRLFDGGAAVAAAEQSELDIEIAESNFSSVRNDIRLQVEQAYFELEANQENIVTAELAVRQAEEAVELANLRFNAGVGTQLDVLTATSELADARGNLVTAILDYNRALASLERAVSNVVIEDDLNVVP